jgi:phosphatidylglycerophosphate synthase
MYFYLLKKSFKINSSYRTFSTVSLVGYSLNKLANFFIPIFFILKFKPNTITAISFFVGLCSLLLIFFYEIFHFAILLYFIFLLLDHIDGGLARLYNQKTFFGKFIDAFSGIFFESLFYVGLSLILFRLNDNFFFLKLSLICCGFYFFDVTILDKFSSLVRWCNDQNNKSFSPYVRQKYKLRLFLIFYDIYVMLIILSPFFINNINYFEIIIMSAFFSMFLSGFLNIILHVFFAHKYLKFIKK